MESREARERLIEGLGKYRKDLAIFLGAQWRFKDRYHL